MLSPEIGLFLGKSGTLSPTGSAALSTAMPMEWSAARVCGVVVLKRLRDAEAAGDPYSP